VIHPRAVERNHACVQALSWPRFDDEVLSRAVQVMSASAANQRNAAVRLEQDFAARMGSRYALVCANGTSSIHAALFGLGLEPGSEVLVPSLTQWASVLPLCWHGLVPIFCDVDPETLCLSIDDAASKISPSTRAVVVVHLFGQVADLDGLLSLAERHDLALIEDASQAIGATYRGRPVGTVGKVGCFSFQSTKNLPAGEGGVMITDDSDLYERALTLGHYRSITGIKGSHFSPLVRTGLGFKSQIHPVAAELACEMLSGFDAFTARLQENVEIISARLAAASSLHLGRTVPGALRTYWTRLHFHFDPARLSGYHRDDILHALLNAGVLVFEKPTPYGVGLHAEPVFRQVELMPPSWGALRDKIRRSTMERTGALSVTEGIPDAELITVPVFLGADLDFVRRYADWFVSALEELE